MHPHRHHASPLTHRRSANEILSERVMELEAHLKTLGGGSGVSANTVLLTTGTDGPRHTESDDDDDLP
jgi:hypothetical protein